MAVSAFLGRNVYAYVGGNAVIHLRGWTASKTTEFTKVDPDIGALITISQPVNTMWSGTLNFNLTGDDFANLNSSAGSLSAVALYMYLDSSAGATSKQYLYGNAFIGTLNVNADIGGTVNGSVEWAGSDTTGMTIQSRA